MNFDDKSIYMTLILNKKNDDFLLNSNNIIYMIESILYTPITNSFINA